MLDLHKIFEYFADTKVALTIFVSNGKQYRQESMHGAALGNTD